MDIEVRIRKIMDELPYYYINAVNKSMSRYYYYSESDILTNIYNFRNRKLVDQEYHYNEDGTFNTCVNRGGRYVLRKEENDIMYIDFI
jgi:hypothetical protein